VHAPTPIPGAAGARTLLAKDEKLLRVNLSQLFSPQLAQQVFDGSGCALGGVGPAAKGNNQLLQPGLRCFMNY
jgi:hypothetical protein